MQKLNLSQWVAWVGRIGSTEHPLQPIPSSGGSSPPRERFYLTTDEFRLVGIALNHFKQHLRKSQEHERLEVVDQLDHRLYQCLCRMNPGQKIKK